VGVLNAFKLRMNTLAIVLIPVCIAIDWAGHVVASTLKLPLFLDSIGTVLGGLLAGPWVGGIAGLIANFISSGTVDPTAAPYAIVSLGIGFAAGIAGYYGWHKTWAGRIALYVLVVLVASIGSTPINIHLYGGQSGSPFGDTVILTGLTKAGFPSWFAAWADEASGDIPDKFITVVVAILIFLGLPNRYRALFAMWRRQPTGAVPAPAPIAR
jgi:energy-coupling factor transport system substrate-specific component